MVKIAICYWGIPRTIRDVLPSQNEYVFEPLRKMGIEYDIYAHFWKIDVNRVWNWVVSEPLDYNSVYLLGAKKISIEDQQPFLNGLNMHEYYYEHEKDTEWCPQLLRNHLCALESQKRCMNLCISANIAYDYVLFLRPDAIIESPLPVHKIFEQITVLGIPDHFIYLPADNHYEGLNDRFAMMRFENALWYSHRINHIRKFRKEQGRIVAEKYVKYVVDRHYYPLFIEFYFGLLRSDGTIM